MPLDLTLSSSAYKKFLKAFRQEDKNNAGTGAETEVRFDDGVGTIYRYYFRAPNFQLIAYDVGAGRVNLTGYNHVDDIGSVARITIEAALKEGGRGATTMNKSLSRVVALTSEAARSKVVENAMTKAIKDGTMVNLNEYHILFKAYDQPARYNGFRDRNGNYSDCWKPMEKEHYQRFFRSMEYTGDKEDMCAKVANL